MLELDKTEIRNYISKVNFRSEEITREVILAEVLYYILELDLSLLNHEKSYIKADVRDHDISIHLEGNNNEYPFFIFEISNETTVDIRVGEGEGEYLFNQKMADLTDVKILRDTLGGFFYNQLTEEVIYCSGSVIGNNCAIPYNIDGETKTYIFKKRMGVCLPWNRKIVKRIYKPWIETNE